MDILSMILARSQGGGSSSSGGYTEEKKYTFDGNAEGKETINIGYNLVKVSNECIDLSKVTEVYYAVPYGNENLFGIHIIYNESEPFALCWQERFDTDVASGVVGGSNPALPDGTPVVMVVPEDMEEDGTILAKGTYVFCDITDFGYKAYISSIVTETIHPIDPKYIPAMDSITLNGEEGKKYKVFVNENGQLVTEEVSS